MSESTKERKSLSKAVDAFALQMKAKLYQKQAEGWRGWDSSSAKPAIKRSLILHTCDLYAGESQQAIDVANLAMMLWFIDQKEND